jgi:serine/threonine protein kinase
MLFFIFFFQIGDFGEARSFTGDVHETITALGTMLYMAPEIVRNEKYVFFVFLME